MAFVPGYKHDIFISYSRKNNQLPVDSKGEGWVTIFRQRIDTKLRELLDEGADCSVWMDERDLSRHSPFDKEIAQNLEKTALLLIILSPRYLESPWCKKERETFLETIASQEQKDSRIFLIEYDPVPVEKKPPELKKLLGFTFWEPQGEGENPLPLLPSSDRYIQKLNDLCYSLKKHLEQLKTFSDNPPEKKPNSASLPAVFLAEVTDDLEDERSQIKRVLDQQGIAVFPQHRLTLGSAEEFQQEVQQELEKCELFVQLLSKFPGKTPTDMQEKTYNQLQFELAEHAYKRTLLWHRPGLDIAQVTDNSHKKLLTQAIVEHFGNFKSTVLAEVVKIQSINSAKQRFAHTYIFLNANKQDEILARQLLKILEKQDFDIGLPLWDIPASQAEEELKRELRLCRGLMIVYGEAPVLWVREQLRKYIEYAMVRKPLALYEGPPEAKSDHNASLRGMVVCNCRQGLKEECLQPFFDAVRAGEAR